MVQQSALPLAPPSVPRLMDGRRSNLVWLPCCASGMCWAQNRWRDGLTCVGARGGGRSHGAIKRKEMFFSGTTFKKEMDKIRNRRLGRPARRRGLVVVA